MLTSGYRFLQHTTDAYVESVGASFEEALQNAGLALFDTMCDLNAISHEREDTIAVDGADDLELLYNWLEALLLKFELERRVYSKFKVSLSKGSKGLRLSVRAYGEIFDRKKHGPKVEVKAVTYHRMEVSREGTKVTLRFILDL